MVHALENVGKTLRLEGNLISIQAFPAPHLIEVHTGNVVTKAGWLLDNTSFEPERSAFLALNQVVDNSIFRLCDEQEFGFNLNVDGIQEFEKMLSETWQSFFIPNGTRERILEVHSVAKDPVKIILKVPARMTKLRLV